MFTDKDKVLLMYPDAHIDPIEADDGLLEVWAKYHKDTYDCIGAGETEDSAWSDALDFITGLEN